MFFTNLSGVVFASHSTPAWWIVMYLAVCLRSSGMGCGDEPHSLADTLGGFDTPGVTSGFFASWFAHATLNKTSSSANVRCIMLTPLLDDALREAESLRPALRIIRVRRVEAR